ncbi:MAG: hypothetical protein CVT60_00860 [Actinobacteria bacterium HGW-Actinobacteria-10]|jgi:hypothetical protein|nr:MAG: hypothetical protein CVT60_00860 [Actinobacteria bacterium HGW-Actinobacteria-10]
MTLLLNLYLGHLLGDFVFQPGWLVAAKRHRASGLILHVVIIGICTAILLGGDVVGLLGMVALAMAAHLAIEMLTIRLRFSEGLSALSVFIVDQGLHLTSLVALVWAASRLGDIERVQTLGLDVGPAMLAMACSLLGVTFMGAIIIHEVGNSFGPETFRRAILPYDAPRIYGMIERGLALVLAIQIHPALVLAPFVPRALYLVRLQHDARLMQALAALVGMLVCISGYTAVTVVVLAVYR